MRRAPVFVAALPLVLLLAGCPSAGGPTDPGPPPALTNGKNTVSGTITSYDMDLALTATVVLNYHGFTVATDVTLAPGPTTGAQVATYSFPGVEDLTDVGVTLTATSQNGWDSGKTFSCVATQDKVNQIPSIVSGNNPKVFTLSPVNIADSTTIDITLQEPLGGGGHGGGKQPAGGS
jgi:hypothetical protein